MDNPDRLIEIGEWESAEAREAHMKAAAATGIYAPLKDLLAEPFKVTIIKQLDQEKTLLVKPINKDKAKPSAVH